VSVFVASTTTRARGGGVPVTGVVADATLLPSAGAVTLSGARPGGRRST
jgi:hypothetical protein